MMRIFTALLFTLGTVSGGVSQTPSAGTQTIQLPKGTNVANITGFDTISFDFERAELSPPQWGFELHPDGSGRYYEKAASNPGNAPENVWQDVHVSSATMALLKAGAQRSGPVCETKSKHIAQTGKKVLTYWKGDVPFACTFNYSDNATIMKVADAFESMATTIQYGERLQQKHRFDRLALDAEVNSLDDAMKQGRATEVQNIAPALTALLNDERVMERVRRKVARILQDAGASTTPLLDSAR